MNPYHPPATARPYASIGRRILRGCQFALAEYRRGVRREGLTLLQHVWAWVALGAIVSICLLEISGLLALAYFAVADIQTWGIFFD